jgi:hypothetical protein
VERSVARNLHRPRSPAANSMPGRV